MPVLGKTVVSREENHVEVISFSADDILNEQINKYTVDELVRQQALQR